MPKVFMAVRKDMQLRHLEQLFYVVIGYPARVQRKYPVRFLRKCTKKKRENLYQFFFLRIAEAGVN